MILPRWVAPALAASILAVAVDANAGTLTVRDDARALLPADADHLRALVAQAPFDARLVITTAYADQAELSRYVAQLVSEPNMVVVGIDPQHRHVQVHFGTGSHIPQPQWAAIERAGNDAFKRGAWEEGGADIFRAAAGAVTGTGGVAVPGTAGSGFLGALPVILLIGGVIVVAALFFARRRSQPYGGGYGGGSPFPGNGPGPYYGPGGAPGGGMGPLGGGILGAGLGGVAGYELGKMEGERERGGGFGNSGGNPSGGNGSFDQGGGGSSWGDSGGGGSDFGGGGDSGGGGFGGDSGGGGDSF
jgi:hypothetical protein